MAADGAAAATRALLGLALACWAGAADAQQLPPAGAPSAAALAAAEEAAAAPAPAPATPRPAAAPLRDIRLPASALLTAEDLAAVRAGFAGRPTTAATAAAIAEALTQAYARRGLGLAGAQVAAIDPRAGRIDIALIEPRLGAAVSPGRGTLSAEYLGWRLGLAPGQPIDTARLGQALTALSIEEDIRIDAEFRAATTPGAVDLHLAFPGFTPRGGSLTLDNDGKRATGRARLSLAYGWRSLTGWSDPLSLSFTLSEGERAAALSYSRPITPQGMRLTLGLDVSTSRSRTAPVVSNRAGGGEVGLALPLHTAEDARVGLTVAALGFRERGRIAGAPLVDQRGRGARLGLEARRAGPGWFLAAGGSVTLLRWSDAVTGDGRLGWRGLGLSLAGARQVTPGLVLSGQAAAQLSAGSRAPARHRFTVAGRGGVRGYGTEAPGADSGVWLRLQLEAAEPLGAGPLRWRPFAFVDAGRGWDRLGGSQQAGPRRAAAGLGVSLMTGGRLVGEAHLAHPLIRDPALPASRGAELRIALSLRL